MSSTSSPKPNSPSPPRLPATASVVKKSVLVLCGPSGSGKSSLLKLLMADHPNKFQFRVSHTTREPRPGEENGRHYHFVKKDEFEALVKKKNYFIEYAKVHGNYYGTSKESIEKASTAAAGGVCVLDIDIQGAKSIKNIQDLAQKAVFVFIRPPSIDVLRKRLEDRGEPEENILKRLKTAENEMTFYNETRSIESLSPSSNSSSEFAQKKQAQHHQAGSPAASGCGGEGDVRCFWDIELINQDLKTCYEEFKSKLVELQMI